MTRDLDTEGLMTCCPWRACLIRICPNNPRKEASRVEDARHQT